MKVTLINHTPDALETLIFTKNTRLKMSGTGIEEIKQWPDEKKAEELRYMRNTIQSSWEFVDYVFAIEGVTRAFTHQLVRHRVGVSFAQQAQRVVNMEGFDFLVPAEINADGTGAKTSSTRNGPDAEWLGRFFADGIAEDNLDNWYYGTMHAINYGYNQLIAHGTKTQDARGVLPTNIMTNIVMKANLRTLHEMGLKRLCVKAQGEFQDVFRAMRDAVVAVHPWAADFIRVQCAWSGTCLFPTLPNEQCPVKPHVYDQRAGTAYDGGAPWTIDQIQELHQIERRDIQPVVPKS